MFQRQSPSSKQRPEAFSYSSHGFRGMIVSEFLENRNIILLKFVCTHTSVKILLNIKNQRKHFILGAQILSKKETGIG